MKQLTPPATTKGVFGEKINNVSNTTCRWPSVKDSYALSMVINYWIWSRSKEKGSAKAVELG